MSSRVGLVVAIVFGLALLAGVAVFLWPSPGHAPAAPGAQVAASVPSSPEASRSARAAAPAVAEPGAAARTDSPVSTIVEGSSLQGRVTDALSKLPVVNASVTFGSNTEPYDASRRTLEARTATDGSFVLKGVPDGRVTLVVSAQGYATAERGLVAPARELVEIALSVGSSLAGRLVASDGATPVAGELELLNLETGSRSDANTDETGEFEIAHLNVGRYRLRGQALGGGTDSQEIVLGQDERIGGLVLALTAGLTIRGIVSGLPPEERSRVRVIVRRNDSYVTGVQADEQGTYALRGIRAGRVRIMAQTPVREMWKQVEVREGRDAVVNFDFPSGYSLSGRVLRAGQPAQYMQVMLRPIGKSSDYSSAPTSASGKYLIDTLQAGEYVLFVNNLERDHVLISADTVLDIDLPDASVAGRVVESDGTPITGANVEVIASGGSPGFTWEKRFVDMTDATGAFKVNDLEPGEYTLTVYKPAYELHRQPFSFATSVSGLTITLADAPGVQIRVRDAATNNGIRQLFVNEAGTGRSGMNLNLYLDETGAGSLPESFRGSRLALISPGYLPYMIDAWDGRPLDLRFTPAPD